MLGTLRATVADCRQRLAQALQQMQLAKHERAELAERIGKALQVGATTAGAQQQAFNSLVLIDQRHAQQRLPRRGRRRQKTGFVQAAAQVVEAHHAVLAQGELQQLLTVVIRRQARRFTRLQGAVEAFGVHPQAGVGGVEQIQLRQFATAQLGQTAHEVTQQRSTVRRPRQTGELRQQRFGIDQWLRHLSEHHTHLRRTRTSRWLRRRAWRARA